MKCFLKSCSSNEDGALHVLLILIFLAFSMAAFGSFFWLHRWNKIVQTQMDLDRCVGSLAIHFKTALTLTQKINSSIVATRTAIEAAQASLQFEAIPPLEVLLNSEALAQEAILGSWKIKQTLWLTQQGCHDIHGLPLPLPGVPYKRDIPPDLTGPQPARWSATNGRESARFYFGLSKGSRASAALVELKKKGITYDDWKANWTHPFKKLREWANLD